MDQKRKEQFCRLVKNVSKEMYCVAYHILENEEDSKDIVSEAIATAYEKFGTVREEEKFNTWILAIVANKAKNYRRVRKREFLGKAEEYAEEQGQWDSYNEWEDIIEKIPQPYKLVLKLYHCEDYNISEISKILKIPKGTAKSRLARGERILRKEFRGEDT